MTSRWRERAACRSAKPEWFVLPDSKTAHPYAATAGSICGGCPVAAECLSDARANRDVGVFRAGIELRTPLVMCKNVGCDSEPVYGGVGTRPSYCSPECKVAAEAHRAVLRAEQYTRQKAKRDRKKVAPAVRTHCNNRHELAVVGTVVDSGGRRLCAECRGNRWPARTAVAS